MLSNPYWLNSARYRHGLAETYRKGRAVLVGDAARSDPPLYGQGMNYGMQDSWNLAWKLAYVVKGLGPEELLDTYAAERRKLGAELDKRIDSTFRFITDPKPFQSSLVRAVLPPLLSSDRIQSAFGQQLTEMELTYAGVGLNEKETALGDLKSGTRAPALWVKRLPDCALANLLDLYDGRHWTLLVIAAPEEDGSGAAARQALMNYAGSMQSRFPQALQAVLLSEGPKRPGILPFTTLVDAEARFIREHHLPRLSLLLVRPDGYLAWAAKEGDAELDSYLEHWLYSSAQR